MMLLSLAMQPLKSRLFLLLLMQSLSAKELYIQLKKDGFNCTYSAVYKTLKQLQKEKAISKIKEKYIVNNSWIQSNLKLLRTAQSCSYSFSENFTANNSKTFFILLKNFYKNSKRKVLRLSFIPPEFFADTEFFQNSDLQIPTKNKYEKLFKETLKNENISFKPRPRQSLDFFINDTSILYLFNSTTFLKNLKKNYLKTIKNRNNFLLKHERLEESPLHSKEETILTNASLAQSYNKI